LLVGELPRGTVTFLFTDIEGSTRLLRELGDGYVEALAEHRRLLREAFARHGGVEVDTQGDAFFVAFAQAGEAVAAAEEGQRALVSGPVRVRMGIHSGEPVVTEDGYVGIDVHRGARICATAHGGQIVFSESTQALLGDGLPIEDLGLHRLKDLAEPVKLFQLGDGEFPPLRSLNATNLPTQPTPLVGRERELAEVLELLISARLVTLTGAGGSGKTRLALQAAAELVEEFKDGVFWVSLAALTDPELVLPTITATVGAKEDLARFVDEKRLLLLLDNLEQIVECGPALAELLHSCPNLKLLVTSRAALRIVGEQEYEVAPLPESDAAQLFTQRARQVKPGFEPDEHVVEICRRLDGLPLALELAAVRIKLLSTQQILERLGRSLELLTSGARDVTERQRTLRATIEWSYELLDDGEKRLFALLAVFAGSFDLQAAQEIAEADLDALASLLDNSLLRRARGERFFMLETIREYALRQLEQSPEAAPIPQRHAEYFLGLTEAAEPELKKGDRQARWLRRLDEEHANLRAALVFFTSRGELEVQLRLAAALGRFWYLRGHLAEGKRWLDDALAKGGDQPAWLRAKALTGATYIALARGDPAEGKRFATQRLTLYRALGESAGVAEALNDLAWAAALEGDLAHAEKLEEEASDLFLAAGDAWGLAVSLNNLAGLAWGTGDYKRALAMSAESEVLARELGDKHLAATALSNGAWAHLKAGKVEDSGRLSRESLVLAQEIGDMAVVCRCLEALAAVFLSNSDGERAARILGRAEALAEATGISLEPAERELHDQMLEELRHRLPETTVREAWSEGAAMTLEQVLAEAAGPPTEPAVRESRP
jgi:predicted ATPase/class 3 adenylate cyclase